MNNMNENFAAIAVIGQLYDAGKDIYDVLAAYLDIVIKAENMDNFTSVEITDRINRANSFRVSEAIVKTSLKRLGLKRSKGVYSTQGHSSNKFSKEKLDAQIDQNIAVLESLYTFIEVEEGTELNADQRLLVQEQFYKYLMDPDYSDSYTAIISKFILKSTLDERILTIIRSIKEGLLVYEGISFSPEFGQAGKWDFELNIFLELEIIFYLAGYNGDIHKEIYGQLLDYIKEINSISNTRAGKTIRLFYTEDVRIEIDNYFTTAESIFDKHEVVDPSKKAMTYLLEDVTSKADIRIKKVQLYNFLRGKDILEFKVDFFLKKTRSIILLLRQYMSKIVTA